MTTETRSFHIGDILSITTERLVSPNHMDGIHQILDWMTSDTLFSHQLGRAVDECVPALRAQHPDLAAVTVPDDLAGEEPTLAWLAEQVAIFGETREVARLAAADHTRIDPIAELAMKHPGMPVVVVKVEGDAS